MIDQCLSDSFGTAEIIEYVVLFLLMCMTAACRVNPQSYLYWPSLLLISAYVLASVIPPSQSSCADFSAPECLDRNGTNKVSWYMAQAQDNFDCSLTSISSTLLFMTWILILPWLVYTKSMIHLTWSWLLVYVLWTGIYSWAIKDEGAVRGKYDVFSRWDVLGRFILLSITVIIATIKKGFIEASGEKKFLADVQVRQACEKVFRVFSYMVPTHVVRPMLVDLDKTIADDVEKVTIMFVLITEFEERAQGAAPEELLNYLNKHFSKMDDICKQNGVTKIETVGEEYVACVGVIPEDIDEARIHGHGASLHRLFQAGSDILKLQTDELKLKIGVHTGPIMAGVIGHKLPRYRLFGDTINTAARMMQKGQAGRLQFGEATHSDLPPGVETSYRGEVEMKGKGAVKAWFFEKMAETDGNGDSDKEIPYSLSVSPAAFSGDLESAGSEKDKELFAQVVDGLRRQAMGMGDKHQTAFSLFPAFTPEMEQEWFKDFHEHTFMKKFMVRLTRQLVLLSGMTLFELLFWIWIVLHYKRGIDAATGEHTVMATLAQYAWRLPIYLLCRSVSVGLVLYCRYYYSQWTEWMEEDGEKVQRYMLLVVVVICMLTFFSHNALTIPNASGTVRKNRPTVAPGHDEIRGPPGDQLFLPIFVLSFYVLSTAHSFRFYPSLFVIPVVICIVLLATAHHAGRLYFSLSGKFLFVIQCCMNVYLAFDTEQESRLRFQAKAVVKETNNRTETILKTLMPPLVVEQLQKTPGQLPSKSYKRVTVQQSDLCGFTKLASTRTPKEVVDFISELFGMFDRLTDKYGIYKVETIGDAYIAATGEQPLTFENKPINVIRFGLESVQAVIEWSKRLVDRDGGDAVGCRVGIHFGDCIGGVVGTDMQRYHLFGGLMSVLEIMESCGREAMVHVSSAAYAEIREAMEKENVTDLEFVKRTDPTLTTSKGESHSYSEAGGDTYFVSLKEQDIFAM